MGAVILANRLSGWTGPSGAPSSLVVRNPGADTPGRSYLTWMAIAPLSTRVYRGGVLIKTVPTDNALIASDDFNRADGAPGSTPVGALAWTEQFPATPTAIVSNQLSMPAGSMVSLNTFNNPDTRYRDVDDRSISVTYVSGAIGFSFNIQGGTSFAKVNVGSVSAQIVRADGVTVANKNFTVSPLTPGSVFTMRIENIDGKNASKVTLLKDNVELISIDSQVSPGYYSTGLHNRDSGATTVVDNVVMRAANRGSYYDGYQLFERIAEGVPHEYQVATWDGTTQGPLSAVAVRPTDLLPNAVTQFNAAVTAVGAPSMVEAIDDGYGIDTTADYLSIATSVPTPTAVVSVGFTDSGDVMRGNPTVGVYVAAVDVGVVFTMNLVGIGLTSFEAMRFSTADAGVLREYRLTDAQTAALTNLSSLRADFTLDPQLRNARIDSVALRVPLTVSPPINRAYSSTTIGTINLTWSNKPYPSITRVYRDGVLVYTSPTVTGGTGTFSDTGRAVSVNYTYTFTTQADVYLSAVSAGLIATSTLVNQVDLLPITDLLKTASTTISGNTTAWDALNDGFGGRSTAPDDFVTLSSTNFSTETVACDLPAFPTGYVPDSNGLMGWWAGASSGGASDFGEIALAASKPDVLDIFDRTNDAVNYPNMIAGWGSPRSGMTYRYFIGFATDYPISNEQATVPAGGMIGLQSQDQPDANISVTHVSAADGTVQLFARAVDASNYIYAEVSATATRILKNVAGVVTQLGTAAGVTLVAGDIVSFDFAALVGAVTVNAVSKLSGVALPASIQPGTGVLNLGTGPRVIDNLLFKPRKYNGVIGGGGMSTPAARASTSPADAWNTTTLADTSWAAGVATDPAGLLDRLYMSIRHTFNNASGPSLISYKSVAFRVPYTTVPPAPANFVVAVGATAGTTTLTWDAVPGASKYRLLLNGNLHRTVAAPQVTVSTNSDPNTTGSYELQTIGATGFFGPLTPKTTRVVAGAAAFSAFGIPL